MGNPKQKRKKGGDKKTLNSGTVAKIQRTIDEIRVLEVEVAEMTDDLAQFRDRDLPAFDKWIAKHFSDERRTLDEIVRETEILSSALDRAQLGMAMGAFKDPAKAFRQMEKEIRARHQNDDGDDDGGEAFNDKPPLGEVPEVLVDAMLETYLAELRGINIDDLDEDEYEKYRAQMMESFQHMAEGNQGAFEKTVLRIGADESAGNLSAVKIAYRRLAKRLHPDASGAELNEAEKNLWTQASAYYQALDTGGLETVDVRLSLLRGEAIEPARFPALRRCRDDLKGERDGLMDDWEDAALELAWGFSKRKVDPDFKKMIQDELRGATEQARHRLHVLERSLAYLRQMPAKGTKGKTKTAKQKKKATAKKKAAKKKAPATRASNQGEFVF